MAQLRDLGVEVEVVEATPAGVDLKALMAVLGARGLISVLIEGGASVLGSAFDAQLVDKVVAMLAPRVIGGETAAGAVGGAGAPTLAAARLLRDVSVEQAGPDLIVSGYCVG
jgi:diaminohydroxyphosphoribosylaminopyrimidine deaminase/5-amino-6-(5-phosphoribosylamino)uracil reductase